MSHSRPAVLILAVLLLAQPVLGLYPGRCDGPAPASDSPLGETPAQIAQRYGPVLRHNARVRHHRVLEGGTAMDGDLYEKNGIIVRVVYQRGRAVLLEFNREAGPLSSADVDLLLASASSGFAWEEGKPVASATDTGTGAGAMRMYHRADNRAVANWTTDADGSLIVATEDANTFDDKLLP
jgi:hypothetical protein